jgi:hypothetical protein
LEFVIGTELVASVDYFWVASMLVDVDHASAVKAVAAMRSFLIEFQPEH